MNSSIKLLTLLVGGSFLAGCAATAVIPGAEKVLVSRNAAPKGCKFKGSVIGEQGGALTGGWTSNKNLAEGAMNDMKNKAHSLGANYVVIENSTAGNTSSGNWYSSHGQQTDITHMGNAYQCNPADIGIAE